MTNRSASYGEHDGRGDHYRSAVDGDMHNSRVGGMGFCLGEGGADPISPRPLAKMQGDGGPSESIAPPTLSILLAFCMPHNRHMNKDLVPMRGW
jgi:hypothetical protein